MMPWNTEDLTFDESRFSGTARIIPLPNLVMFPHVMQPLQIRDPCHHELLSEALDHDGLIALSIYSCHDKGSARDQGSARENRSSCEKRSSSKKCGAVGKTDSHHPEAIESTACLGKIVTHQRLEDGGYQLLMLGMRRLRIVRELVGNQPFRRADVELLEDQYRADDAEERAALQTALTHRFQQCLPSGNFPSETIREALSSEIPLGVLTDLVSFAIPLDYDTKYTLLQEQDVDRRAWSLLKAMDTMTACLERSGQLEADTDGPVVIRKGKFPPPFSSN
jgi:Lon protease-like protein